MLISSEVVSNCSVEAKLVLFDLSVGDVYIGDFLKVVCSVESMDDVVISVDSIAGKIVVLISDG